MDSLTDARSLQLAVTMTEFFSALVIHNSCLKYIQALTSSLQTEVKDIVAAMRDIGTVTATVQDVLQQQYKMCVTTLTHIILGGFLPFLRRCQKWVWSHLSREDVVDKSTAALCQLTPRLITIDASSPSLGVAIPSSDDSNAWPLHSTLSVCVPRIS